MLPRKDLLAPTRKFHSGQILLDDARAEAIVSYDCGNQLMHASRNGIVFEYLGTKVIKKLSQKTMTETPVHREVKILATSLLNPASIRLRQNLQSTLASQGDMVFSRPSSNMLREVELSPLLIERHGYPWSKTKVVNYIKMRASMPADKC